MSTELSIFGMTCSDCAQRVEKALSGVEGVERADVDYLRKQANVQGEADIETLIRAVAKAGYLGVSKASSDA